MTRPDVVDQVHRSFLEVGVRRGRDRHLRRLLGRAGRVRPGRPGPRAQPAPRPSWPARWRDEFSTPDRPRWVAGSMGPGTKFPTLGQISYAELRDAYEEQALGPARGRRRPPPHRDRLRPARRPRRPSTAPGGPWRALGPQRPAPGAGDHRADRAHAAGHRDRRRPHRPRRHAGRRHRPQLRHRPGRDGRAPAPPVGGQPRPHRLPAQRRACRRWSTAQMHYDLTPDELAEHLHRFVTEFGVSAVGGCCGTTPAHLAAVVDALRRRRRRPPARPVHEPAAASIYTSVPFHQDTSFLVVGERTNANGSKEVPRGHARRPTGTPAWPWPATRSRRAPTSSTCASTTPGADGVADMDEVASRLRHPVERAADGRLHRGPGGRGRAAVARRPADPQLGQPRGGRRARAPGSTRSCAWPASSAPPWCAPASTRRARPARPSGSCGRPAASTTSPSSATGCAPEDLLFDPLALPLSTGMEESRARRHRDHRGHPAHQGRAARRLTPSSGCPTCRSGSTRPPARCSTRSSCTSASRPASTRPSCTRPRSCRCPRSTSGPGRSAST